jgi:C4-dicarboxylate transporter DctQ subunit
MAARPHTPPAGGDPRLGMDASSQGAAYAALSDKAASELHVSDNIEGTRLEQIMVGILALAALLICIYNVFVRYFYPPLTLEMSDEVQVYLVIWSVFLALGLVTAANRHVKADLFVSMFKQTTQKHLHKLSDVLGLAFSLLLVYYGTAVAWETYDYGDVSITSLRFPLWIYAAALPTGALLMGIRYALRLSHMVRKTN